MKYFYILPWKKCVYLSILILYLNTGFSIAQSALVDISGLNNLSIGTTKGRAIDNNPTTYWETTTSDRIHSIRMSPGRTVRGYALTVNSTLRPTGWIVRGSNNGSSWTEIDRRSSIVWQTNIHTYSRMLFKVATPASYTYYQIEFNQGVRIAELEYFENFSLSGTVYEIKGGYNNNAVSAQDTRISTATVYLKSIHTNTTIQKTTNNNGSYTFNANELDKLQDMVVIAEPPAGMIPLSEKMPQASTVFSRVYPDGVYQFDPLNYRNSNYIIYANAADDINFGFKPAVVSAKENNPNLITNEQNGTFGQDDPALFKSIHPNARLFDRNKSFPELYRSVSDYKPGKNYVSAAGLAIGTGGLLILEGKYTVTGFLGTLSQERTGKDSGLLNTTSGGWRSSFGATTGTWNDRFLAVNGSDLSGGTVADYTVFADTVPLLNGNTYSFGFNGKNANKFIQGNSYLIPVAVNYRLVNLATNKVVSEDGLILQPSVATSRDSAHLGWQVANSNYIAEADGQYAIYYYIRTVADRGNDLYLDNFYFRKSSYKIRGKVYNDLNGATDNAVNGNNMGNGYDGTGVYAALIDPASKTVVDYHTVPSTGEYVLSAPEYKSYDVVIINKKPELGELYDNGYENLGNFVYTGSLKGINNAEGSGFYTGKELISVYPNDVTKDITSVNFGYNKLPTANDKSFIIKKPEVNDTKVLVMRDDLGQLTGADYEDGVLNGNNSDKAIRIHTLPVGAILYYNGVEITEGQIIPNYNAEKLTVKFTVNTSIVSFIEFKYQFKDKAAQLSLPAIYKIEWDNDDVLPVKLVAFTTGIIDQTIQLNWRTAWEQNNDGFEIYRSHNGQQWEKIGFVKSKALNGNAEEHLIYSYIDTNPLSGVNYYQLKQIDFDGKWEYSEIRKETLSANKTLWLYPNPTKGLINIQGLEAGGKLYIYDLSGKQLLQKNTVNPIEQLNITAFANGVYMITYEALSGERTTTKVIKE